MKLYVPLLFAASLSIPAPFALAQGAPPSGIPKADMARTKEVQADNHRISAAATISWYVRHCKSNLDQGTVSGAESFLTGHKDQARVNEIRRYIELGAQRMKDPCTEGEPSVQASLLNFNSTQ